MEIIVECAIRDRGEITPERIHLGKRRIEVVDVIDRWLSPDHDHFKVIGDDGATYIVRRDGNTGVWELEFFEADRAS